MLQNLSFAFALLAAPTIASAASTVYFTNDAHERLCIAVGENPDSPLGVKLLIQGWTCIDQGGTLVVSLDSGTRYVLIKDSTGRDYVARSPTRFLADQGYIPAEEIDRFGLEIVAAFEGYFTYRYAFGNESWSLPESTADFETLETEILSLGFRKVNAWKFRKSDYPGGIGIRLGEFG